MPRPIVACSLLAAALAAVPVHAADQVVGTLTVKGATTRLTNVYVVRKDPSAGKKAYLIVLLADGPIAEADRVPDRLKALATAGKVHAIRMAWQEGFSGIQVTPYDNRVDQLGIPTTEGHLIDLEAYDERRLDATLHSRMIGQDWHYNARVKAAVVPGGDVPLEVAPAETVGTLPTATKEEGTPTALKRALGRKGFEYDEEDFMDAIAQSDAEAVDLFLKAGMSPDTRGKNQGPAIVFAATFCSADDVSAAVSVIRSLLAAHAKVDAPDENNSTALIWAAQMCPLEAVELLVKAGANVNARAKGGATPLMMAEVMKKDDVAAFLKKAGAKPWQK